MRLSKFSRAFGLLAFASAIAIAAGAARAAEAVVVPGSTDFPESMSADAAGNALLQQLRQRSGLAREAR